MYDNENILKTVKRMEMIKFSSVLDTFIDRVNEKGFLYGKSLESKMVVLHNLLCDFSKEVLNGSEKQREMAADLVLGIMDLSEELKLDLADKMVEKLNG